VGARGVTQTPLRLSGQARFDGVVYDVISRDEYLDPRVEVIVQSVSGSRIEVIAAASSAEASQAEVSEA
jgi:membrane-bound ClpP family serine protease